MAAPGTTVVRRIGLVTAPRWIAVCNCCGDRTRPAELLSTALADDDKHRAMHRRQAVEGAAPPRQEAGMANEQQPPPQLEQLAAAAARSGSRRTQRLGEKLTELAAELRTALAEERRAAEAEQQRQRALEQLRQEVDELEARLAEKRAQLRGRPARTSTPAAAVDNRAIREWARQQGVECPAVGRVPHGVVEAYRAATERAAS